MLKGVIEQFGPSSETNGLLGRIYKDRWDIATRPSGPRRAASCDAPIETYLEGFQADWRDAYPGVNAVSLMELQASPTSARPVPARGALPLGDAQGKQKNPDYWDHATLMELAVLGPRRR